MDLQDLGHVPDDAHQEYRERRARRHDLAGRRHPIPDAEEEHAFQGPHGGVDDIAVVERDKARKSRIDQSNIAQNAKISAYLHGSRLFSRMMAVDTTSNEGRNQRLEAGPPCIRIRATDRSVAIEMPWLTLIAES